jgi:hypothetical protein
VVLVVLVGGGGSTTVGVVVVVGTGWFSSLVKTTSSSSSTTSRVWDVFEALLMGSEKLRSDAEAECRTCVRTRRPAELGVGAGWGLLSNGGEKAGGTGGSTTVGVVPLVVEAGWFNSLVKTTSSSSSSTRRLRDGIEAVLVGEQPGSDAEAECRPGVRTRRRAETDVGVGWGLLYNGGENACGMPPFEREARWEKGGVIMAFWVTAVSSRFFQRLIRARISDGDDTRIFLDGPIGDGDVGGAAAGSEAIRARISVSDDTRIFLDGTTNVGDVGGAAAGSEAGISGTVEYGTVPPPTPPPLPPLSCFGCWSRPPWSLDVAVVDGVG